LESLASLETKIVPPMALSAPKNNLLNKAIFTGKSWEQSASHAPARHICGDLLVTSGITARAPDGSLVAPYDMRGQSHQVVANVADILLAAGTTADKIVKVTIYVVSIDEFVIEKDIWSQLFIGRPASTLIEVKRLQDPEMVVEIEVLAQVS